VEARFIYQNRSDSRFYDASTGEMHGGPDKVIVYLNGVLCAMDREAKIAIPVSRWELAEIGMGCLWAALRRKRTASRPRKLSGPEPEPEPIFRLPPDATDVESPEAEWEHLLREMRDLSR
jgi:hypothetical protein